jgi:hypothetical protein
MPVTVSDDPIAVDAGEPCEECCEPGVVTDCCDSVLTLAATLYGTVTASACAAFTVTDVIQFDYVGFYNPFGTGTIDYYVWVMTEDVTGCTLCERLALILRCTAPDEVEWRIITVGVLSGGQWFREADTCPVSPTSQVVACGGSIYPTSDLTISGNSTSGCCVGQAVSLDVAP